MWTKLAALSKIVTFVIAASSFLWLPVAMAANPLTFGVIQYNAKASQGGWTPDPKYGAPLANQIALLVDKVKDKSNPSPVEFVSLDQAGAPATPAGIPLACDPTKIDSQLLLSCAFQQNGLLGWKTVVSECNSEQTELSYSPEWELVPTAGNPLVNGYGQARWKCWSKGRSYNIALFRKIKTNEQVLFVIVHMPHRLPICTPTPGGGSKCDWNIQQFQKDIGTVAGKGTSLKSMHLVVAGDMNDMGNDNDPANFQPIFGAFGDVAISQQAIVPPVPTCCANDRYTAGFYDRVVTNGGTVPTAAIVNLQGHTYPLNKKMSGFPGPCGCNEEHKAIYSEVTFP